MTYSGAYAAVLILHLLTVAFLVGPLAVAGVVSAGHARAGRAEALRSSSRTSRTYAGATLLTVLLGSAMIGLGDIGEQWGFGQLWVSASFTLWFVAVALTLGLVVPAQDKAAAVIEAGGDGSALAGRITVGAGLAMLAWVAIFVLMVTKPGA